MRGKNILYLVAAMTLISAAGRSAVAEPMTLDGIWNLTVEGEVKVRQIRVPGCWQSQFADLCEYSGRARYSRRFSVPKEWEGKAVILHFGAVDWFAEVSVNGKPVGSHEGGYTHFELDISGAVDYGGENELSVQVTDPGPGKPMGDFDFSEIPHGKQSWYGNVSGIWQSVYVEARNPLHIRLVKITPDIDTDRVIVRAYYSKPAAGGEKLVVSIFGPQDMGDVAHTEIDLPPKAAVTAALLNIPNAKLWSPDEPNLYQAEIQLQRSGEVLDDENVLFGMRKIEARDGKLLLNKQPIYLISALDQDFYPLHQYTPPSDDYLREQFEKAKHLGLNSLRCHIKVPDPRYLDWADRLGLLVWYEIPNWDILNENSKRRAREMLDAMLDRDWNHPSLVIISLINESWGIDLSKEDQRRWLAEMYDYAKSLESGRLIVDNSACGGNFHIKTDIEDFHAYHSIPDHAKQFSRWIADFASHPDWTFSPHGDGMRRGGEPLILSEFGNWGLPSIGNLRKEYGGREPWWFECTRGSNTCPSGAEERFKRWGLGRIFGDWNGLAEAFQDQEWRALKWQIEEMRKHTSIVGYVITEFTDLQWEANGLLDYCRNPKTFYDVMRTVQAQDIIIPSIERASYWEGEELGLPVWVSHFSASQMANCRLRWKIGELGLEGEIGGITIARGEAREIGKIGPLLPSVERPTRAEVRMELSDPSGKVLATNTQEFIVLPRRDTAAKMAMPVFSQIAPDEMRKQGIDLTSKPAEARLLVLEHLDEICLKVVQEGGTAILIARDPSALSGFFGGPRIEPRSESGRWGDWCSSVIWFEPGLFERLPVRKTLDFAFQEIIPTHVITGFDPEKDRDDIHSGIFVGWVGSPAAIVAGFRAGRGRILMTTFPFQAAYGKDPFATAALHKLMSYAVSPRFKPGREFRISAIHLTETFIPTAEEGRVEWKYTMEPPGPGWEQPDFDDSGWKIGKAGFGTEGTPNAIIGTRWDTERIWLRYEGKISGEVDQALIRIYHDEDAQVFMNGKEIIRKKGYITSYEDELLDGAAIAAFRPGRNVVAVTCRQTTGGQFIDLGIKLGLRNSR